MKKLFRILLFILPTWLALFATDLIFASVTGRPIFVIKIAGGDLISYLGLGYSFDFFRPLAAAGEGVKTPFIVHPWIFVCVNAAIVIAIVIYSIVQTHKKRRAICDTARKKA